MEFCEKCGTMLMSPKCNQCGTKKKGNFSMETREESKNDNKGVVICGNEESVNPVCDWICRKCGHEKSEFWIRQMRSGDEPESKFYKCCKCGKISRVDD
jgi:transcription factor S